MISNRINRYRQYEKLAPKYDCQIASILDRAAALMEPCTGHWLADLIEKRKQGYMKNLLIYGDLFFEKIYDADKRYAMFQPLPADSMYRIETTKGKLLEFQQSKTGPDYEALARCPVAEMTDEEAMRAKAIRFLPEQIVHVRLGLGVMNYGKSLIEKNPDLWDDYDAQALASALKAGLKQLMVDEKLEG